MNDSASFDDTTETSTSTSESHHVVIGRAPYDFLVWKKYTGCGDVIIETDKYARFLRFLEVISWHRTVFFFWISRGFRIVVSQLNTLLCTHKHTSLQTYRRIIQVRI